MITGICGDLGYNRQERIFELILSVKILMISILIQVCISWINCDKNVNYCKKKKKDNETYGEISVHDALTNKDEMK